MYGIKSEKSIKNDFCKGFLGVFVAGVDNCKLIIKRLFKNFYST